MDPRIALLTELRELAARPAPDFDPDLADDFAATGRRLPYEVQYFARRRHLAALAIAGDSAALDDMLTAVCEERSWALPAHWGEDDPRTCVDLFASETAQTLAEILVLRHDIQAGERVRSEIFERVLDPYLESEAQFHWETDISNWTAVCAGASGMAALALGVDRDVIRARVLPALQSYLFSYGPDGGCVEGVDYWVYGFGYFTYFAEAWQDATGEDLLAGTEAIASFPAAAQLAPGSFATFGDASADPMLPPGLLAHLADRLGVPIPAVEYTPVFADDHTARWAHLTRSLDWAKEPSGTVEPARTLLADVGWYVERRRVDGRMWALAVKGGYNNEPHNHLDLGSVIVAVDGEQLLCDPGVGEYTAAYFGPERYEQVHPSAAWHSIPTVDGTAQQLGGDARAEVTAIDGGVQMVIDAYGDQQLRRRVAWSEDDTAVEVEDIGSDVIESFVSWLEPVIDGDTVTWTGERGSVRLRGIDTAETVVDRVEAPDHNGNGRTLWALRFPLDGCLSFELL